MINIYLFVGPPGSGKGTQSSLLTTKGYEVLSTGDLLRTEVKSGSSLGRTVKSIIDSGNLVSDQLILKLVYNSILNAKCKQIILDGFPRTIEQAKMLTSVLEEINAKVVKVINFESSFSVVSERILGRLICGKCNSLFHSTLLPPKRDNTCDNCNSLLSRRTDDTRDTIKKRYDVYIDQTLPLIEFYGDLVISIDASQKSSDVHNSVNECMHDYVR